MVEKFENTQEIKEFSITGKKPEIKEVPIERTISKAYDAASSAAAGAIRPFDRRIDYKDNLDRAKESFVQGLLEIRLNPEDIQGGGGTYSLNVGDKKAAVAFAKELDKNLPSEYIVRARGTEVIVEIKSNLEGRAEYAPGEV